MLVLFLTVLAAMTAVMLAGWFYQRWAANGGWTDVFWTFGTGLTCAGAALLPVGHDAGFLGRRVYVAAMVAVWAARLGFYVALRVSRHPEDVRYATLRRDWESRFQRNMFWLLLSQAPVTAIVSLSVLFAARQPVGHVRIADVAGLVIFVIALLGESLADRQMAAFKADPANKGLVCDKGLWAWSRHPNYFFEAVIWTAYAVIGLDVHRPWSLLALAAPVTMLAIVRFGTGVPALEAAMLQSKGDAYRRYQAEVSTLLPRPRHS